MSEHRPHARLQGYHCRSSTMPTNCYVTLLTSTIHIITIYNFHKSLMFWLEIKPLSKTLVNNVIEIIIVSVRINDRSSSILVTSCNDISYYVISWKTMYYSWKGKHWIIDIKCLKCAFIMIFFFNFILLNIYLLNILSLSQIFISI